MKKNKVKTFVKEHKKEIIGGAILVAGSIIANKYIKLCKECDTYRKVFGPLCEFDNNFINRVMEMNNESSNALSCIPNIPITINGFGETIGELIEEMSNEVNGNSEVTGLLVFVKEKE